MHDRQLEDLAARARATREAVPMAVPDPTSDPLVDALMAPLASDRAAAILDRVVGSAPAVVVPLASSRRTGWRRGLLVTSLVLAAAAAVLLAVRSPPTDPATSVPLEAIADPDLYTLEVLGGRGLTRGDDAPRHFTAGRLVRLRLRPRDPVEGTVTARVRAFQGEHSLILTWVAHRIGNEGLFELAGPVEDLLAVAPGAWDLEAAVLGPDDAPLWRGRTRIHVDEPASAP